MQANHGLHGPSNDNLFSSTLKVLSTTSGFPHRAVRSTYLIYRSRILIQGTTRFLERKPLPFFFAEFLLVQRAKCFYKMLVDIIESLVLKHELIMGAREDRRRRRAATFETVSVGFPQPNEFVAIARRSSGER